jgi:hypothetical protein
LSQQRLERIDAVLQALKEEGGKLTYAALRQLIVKTTRVSFETAEKYIEEMAAMGRIKPIDVFWTLVPTSEKEAMRTKENS